PPEMAKDLPLGQHPRLRVSGEIGEISFSGAWQPTRGRWYLMLSKQIMKDGGISLGDWVDVRFRVEDQDSVDVPDLLQRAIDADEVIAAAWQALSPGKRRGLAYRVASAKTSGTRQRRIEEVLDILRTGRPLR
ncbi:MAG: YdeI/OmpD-associated family protein, partial [Pseudomonadota bacterium]